MKLTKYSPIVSKLLIVKSKPLFKRHKACTYYFEFKGL